MYNFMKLKTYNSIMRTVSVSSRVGFISYLLVNYNTNNHQNALSGNYTIKISFYYLSNILLV